MLQPLNAPPWNLEQQRVQLVRTIESSGVFRTQLSNNGPLGSINEKTNRGGDPLIEKFSGTASRVAGSCLQRVELEEEAAFFLSGDEELAEITVISRASEGRDWVSFAT